MCGIVGYTGEKKAAPIVYSSLKRLEYRGYDSCGIATLDERIHLKKDAGMLEEVNRKLKFEKLPGGTAIGHTRWATHGAVTKQNAHPHLDCKAEIALVHNGIISNYLELKDELLKKGHKFSSDTDTECIVHLIEENYKKDLESAVSKAISKLKGTYAMIALSVHEPDKLICVRNESPLLLGIGRGEMFIGSDIYSFLHYTKKAVPLDDGEYAVVTKEGYTVKNTAGNVTQKNILDIDWTDDVAEKEGYEHFMLKEIFELPQSAINALNVYPEDIKKLAEMIYDADKVYLAAAGTSMHAAMVGEYWFSQLCSKMVAAVDASELPNKGVTDRKTLVIGVTQSGETYDTLAAMRYAKTKGAKIAAVVNIIGSTAARVADHTVLQVSGTEISVCATKTFVGQLIILLRVAIELAKLRRKNVRRIEQEIQKCPDYMSAVLSMKDVIKKAAEKLTVKNYIYIGKGINLPSALEGALKFKEITYYHAEGMSGGMLKHGTISLIDKDVHTIALIPPECENRAKIISNIQEVKARGGTVIGIAIGEGAQQCDENIVIKLNCSELISPIVFAPAYQLLAYYTAVKLGRDVDKPRALAKSVTVE